jgi:hypothetical protein
MADSEVLQGVTEMSFWKKLFGGRSQVTPGSATPKQPVAPGVRIPDVVGGGGSGKGERPRSVAGGRLGNGRPAESG